MEGQAIHVNNMDNFWAVNECGSHGLDEEVAATANFVLSFADRIARCGISRMSSSLMDVFGYR